MKYTKTYLDTLSKSELLTIYKLWEGNLGIDEDFTTEENLRLLIIDSL